MKNYEFDDWEHQANDTVPHPIATHRRQELTEKATEIILVAEEKESLCDRIARLFEWVEHGQVYPINTFK